MFGLKDPRRHMHVLFSLWAIFRTFSVDNIIMFVIIAFVAYIYIDKVRKNNNRETENMKIKRDDASQMEQIKTCHYILSHSMCPIANLLSMIMIMIYD